MPLIACKKIIRLALFLLLWVIGLACSPKNVDGALHWALNENPQSLDPAMSSDANAGLATGSIFETLLQYHYLKRPYELTPLLAQEMPSYSKDGLTVTIKIKRGVHFQDDPCFPDGQGRELVADDFVYAFKRIADPKNKSEAWWLLDGKIAGINSWRAAPDYKRPISGLLTPDKYTLVVKLAKKYPQFNFALAMVSTAPIAREAVEKYGPEINRHPVGTGPYFLREYIESSRLVLEKNKNFHGENFPQALKEGAPSPDCASQQSLAAMCGADGAGPAVADFDYGKPLPLTDRVVIHIIKERQPEWLNFLAGDLDHVRVPKDSFDSAIENKNRLKGDLIKKGMELSVDSSTTQWWLGFNMEDPLLGKNKLLRKAIALAYNSQKDIELFGLGVAKPANQILPTEIAGFNPKFPPREFNVAKAKELLAKAGYPGGKGLPVIHYDLEGSSLARQMGEYFKNQMAIIGIQVDVRLHTRPELFDLRKKGKHQVIMDGWIADYPDAENFLQLLYGPNKSPGANNSNFDNAEYNRLYLEAAALASSPVRQKIIDRMTEIVLEEQPWVPNWIQKLYNVQQGWLRNYKYSDFSYNDFKYYRVDLEKKKELLKKF